MELARPPGREARLINGMTSKIVHYCIELGLTFHTAVADFLEYPDDVTSAHGEGHASQVDELCVQETACTRVKPSDLHTEGIRDTWWNQPATIRGCSRYLRHMTTFIAISRILRQTCRTNG